MYEKSLFSSSHWHEFSDQRVRQAVNDAKNLSKEKFDANSNQEIVEHITSLYELEPLELRPEEKEQDIQEISIDMSGNFGYVQAFDDGPVSTPGYNVVVKVPFTGTTELFEVQPSTHTLRRFSAKINNGNLLFTKEFPQSSASAEIIKQAVDQEITLYQKEIGHLGSDVSGFNSRLKEQVISAVDNRYEQINKLDSLKTALKIPLEKTNNPSPLNQVKVTVKKIKPLSTKKEEPGAYITDTDYEHIIDSLRSAGASMESNRASDFQDEETLRDVMLVVLSGAITNGIAGGELFHKKGKTDISIPFENKATFVAECKLWKGSKYISEGVDQLLSYTTWRDAKTALVIFNKDNANFSAVQTQIPEIFTAREDYVKSSKQREGEWRFTLTKPDDPGRQIEVHVLLFDLFGNNSKK